MRCFSESEVQGIFSWDVKIWSQALSLWVPSLEKLAGGKALAIGERDGGISLLFALLGFDVVCTDLGGATAKARELHKRFGVEKKIAYEELDVTDLTRYTAGEFDVIGFKSVLGSLGTWEKQYLAAKFITSRIRPGGTLVFAENLTGHPIHKLLRRSFVPWASKWRYLELEELKELFSEFSAVEFKSHGFLGALGRTEGQRSTLGVIDSIVAPRLNPSSHYVLFGSCVR